MISKVPPKAREVQSRMPRRRKLSSSEGTPALAWDRLCKTRLSMTACVPKYSTFVMSVPRTSCVIMRKHHIIPQTISEGLSSTAVGETKAWGRVGGLGKPQTVKATALSFNLRQLSQPTEIRKASLLLLGRAPSSSHPRQGQYTSQQHF